MTTNYSNHHSRHHSHNYNYNHRNSPSIRPSRGNNGDDIAQILVNAAVEILRIIIATKRGR